MITKKQLGVILIIGGLLAGAAIVAVDWLNAGQFAGIGPFQRLALAAAGLVVVVGVTLLPLGSRPA